ncbi:hypothetical protein [Thermoactinomyces mirandus]|uniref:Uncharacterized protein n=1 Tax=Thermoactinomyces mirandus TaxID=2756294 RepID=A0A7W1XUU2_9BACL|nr:hypothetical protein [Thermoactinomyces mirandus]MBA4603699.1 hypothetical protein [Thermoactinomyces mirandus]
MNGKRNRPKTPPRKTKKTKPASVKPVESPKQPPDILSPLSSINIAKVLSGFMTLRSTVHDLSQSIQKIENMLDSACKILELTNHISAANRRHRHRSFPMLSPSRQERKQHQPTGDEEIPVIEWPDEEKPPNPEPPFAPLLQSINIGQIIEILKSPFMQKMLTQIFQPKPASTSSYSPMKRKQG